MHRSFFLAGINHKSLTVQWDICKIDKAKNECGKCGRNFCSEFKFMERVFLCS